MNSQAIPWRWYSMITLHLELLVYLASRFVSNLVHYPQWNQFTSGLKWPPHKAKTAKKHRKMNSQGRGGQGDSGLSLRFDSFVFDLWRFPASWRFSFPSPMVPPMATESAHRTQSRAAYNISRVQSRQDQARLRSWIMTNITNLQLRTLLEKHLTPEQDLHISSQSSQQILTAQFNPAKPQHILPVLTLANQCESMRI